MVVSLSGVVFTVAHYASQGVNRVQEGVEGMEGRLYLLQYRAAWASACIGASALPRSLAGMLRHQTGTSVPAFQIRSCLPARKHDC